MVLAHTWNSQGLLMALCSGIIPGDWDCSIHPGLSPGWLPTRQTPDLLYTIYSSNLVYFILSRDLCRIMFVLHAHRHTHTHTHSGMHILTVRIYLCKDKPKSQLLTVPQILFCMRCKCN